MFCKYCGKSIPDGSGFCSECGKQLRTDTRIQQQPKEKNPVGVLYLSVMVLMLCWSTVQPLWRVLIYGDSFQLSTLIPLVILLAALVLLILLISLSLLHPRVYCLPDLLTILVIGQVLPRLLATPIFKMLSSYGQAAYISYICMNNVVLPVFQFEGVWIILGLILLGLERQKRWNPAKKHWLLLAVFLALRTALSAVMTYPLLTTASLAPEAIGYCVTATRSWSVFSWLLPVSILLTFHRLGGDKIGPIGAALALCTTQLGEFILLPVLIFRLNLGFVGYGLALGLAPLFSFAVLSIAARVRKIQQSAETTS